MLAELILDFLPWPGGSRDRSHDRGTELLGKFMSDRLYVPETDSPGAMRRALNESGWVDGEVIAAGDLRQGKEPSVVAMLTGTALIEVLRPRRSKSLPRHFVLGSPAIVSSPSRRSARETTVPTPPTSSGSARKSSAPGRVRRCASATSPTRRRRRPRRSSSTASSAFLSSHRTTIPRPASCSSCSAGETGHTDARGRARRGPLRHGSAASSSSRPCG